MLHPEEIIQVLAYIEELLPDYNKENVEMFYGDWSSLELPYDILRHSLRKNDMILDAGDSRF